MIGVMLSVHLSSASISIYSFCVVKGLFKNYVMLFMNDPKVNATSPHRVIMSYRDRLVFVNATMLSFKSISKT